MADADHVARRCVILVGAMLYADDAPSVCGAVRIDGRHWPASGVASRIITAQSLLRGVKTRPNGRDGPATPRLARPILR